MKKPGNVVSVLWIDIDGTVRKGKDELGKFVNTKEDVEVFEEVPDILRGYKALGWRIIGVSNQGGVALGHMTMEEAMEAFGETQRQCGEGTFDKIVFCAHSPYDNPPCPCRKPGTLMLSETRNWLYSTFNESYPWHRGMFVGDRPEDEMTAANAGLKFLWAEEWRTGVHLETLRNSQ